VGQHNLVEIPNNLLARLKRDIVGRRIECGMTCLREHEHLLAALDPKQEDACALVGYLAQWVDIGFDRPARVKELLLRFPKLLRAELRLSDYVYLRMAEGMVAMAEEACSEALANFDLVLALGQDLDDKETLAVANFWKARCLRKTGEYDDAFTYTVNARSLALELGHPKMAAVMTVLQSWLLFQRGNSKNASCILREAHELLSETDDYVTLGNIHSSYGRMARREGRYYEAIDHFSRAIEEYCKRDSNHPHLARSLANIALVKRLASLQLGKKIDASLARRRKAGKGNQATKRPRVDYRTTLEQLRQQAFAHLAQAEAIYKYHGSHHGAGTVHLIYGYLYLDEGDFDQAETEAVTAFQLAQQKNDYIVMSRIRLLQCMVENAKLEEEIGGRPDQEKLGRSALKFAQDAIEFAKQTQNRRLLANAYVWEGLSHCNPVLDDSDAAQKAYNLALPFLKYDQGGQLWDDLQALKARIMRTGKVDASLRAWSQGSVGEKSFQQILDEFSELIIPKVWEREGRKVSRVAIRLSISPKKVRRILSRVGIKKKTSSDASKPATVPQKGRQFVAVSRELA
jgi:tetratricopeptide (TPR) repeat protein